MAIIARKGETVDSLIRRLKKELEKSGKLVDLRKHEAYMSPSEKKREKRKRNARLRAMNNSKYN